MNLRKAKTIADLAAVLKALMSHPTVTKKVKTTNVKST